MIYTWDINNISQVQSGYGSNCNEGVWQAAQIRVQMGVNTLKLFYKLPKSVCIREYLQLKSTTHSQKKTTYVSNCHNGVLYTPQIKGNMREIAIKEYETFPKSESIGANYNGGVLHSADQNAYGSNCNGGVLLTSQIRIHIRIIAIKKCNTFPIFEFIWE